MELVLEEEKTSITNTKPILSEEFKQKIFKKIYDKEYFEKTLINAARKINIKYSKPNKYADKPKSY